MKIDLTILDDHPEALAKITEALASVYFGTVLRKDYDQRIGEAYATAFNLCPNYRLTLNRTFAKYKHVNELFGSITSLPNKKINGTT